MLIIGVITTLSGYKLSKNILTREKLKIFNQDAEKIQQWIEERMLNHVNALRGLQAFWIGNNQAVTREKFNLYLDSLNLLNDFPGISSVAFIKRANEKIITTYIKPLADREAALGFDHNTNPERKAFFEQIRDTGQITASDPLALITTNRPGMFLAAPLYADSITPESIIERQRQLVGFLVIVFRDNELFKAIFGRQNPLPDLDFVVYHGSYDNGHNTPKHVLFDSDPEFNPITDTKLLQTKKYISVGNTPWTIVVTAKPSFSLTATEENLPKTMLTVGLALSGVFGLIILSFYRQHLKKWH